MSTFNPQSDPEEIRNNPDYFDCIFHLKYVFPKHKYESYSLIFLKMSIDRILKKSIDVNALFWALKDDGYQPFILNRTWFFRVCDE